jgi:hypothetical protein
MKSYQDFLCKLGIHDWYSHGECKKLYSTQCWIMYSCNNCFTMKKEYIIKEDIMTGCE